MGIGYPGMIYVFLKNKVSLISLLDLENISSQEIFVFYYCVLINLAFTTNFFEE